MVFPSIFRLSICWASMSGAPPYFSISLEKLKYFPWKAKILCHISLCQLLNGEKRRNRREKRNCLVLLSCIWSFSELLKCLPPMPPLALCSQWHQAGRHRLCVWKRVGSQQPSALRVHSCSFLWSDLFIHMIPLTFLLTEFFRMSELLMAYSWMLIIIVNLLLILLSYCHFDVNAKACAQYVILIQKPIWQCTKIWLEASI